jgi:hypothetical protein
MRRCRKSTAGYITRLVSSPGYIGAAAEPNRSQLLNIAHTVHHAAAAVYASALSRFQAKGCGLG